MYGKIANPGGVTHERLYEDIIGERRMKSR
jgi:hypothetical protein